MLGNMVILADAQRDAAASRPVLIDEGNLVEPLITGQALRLPAFGVIVAVAAGGTLLGVLGAFLAVPATAAIVRTGRFLQQQQGDGHQDQAHAEHCSAAS